MKILGYIMVLIGTIGLFIAFPWLLLLPLIGYGLGFIDSFND